MAQTRDAWWDAAPPELKRDDRRRGWARADSRYTWKYRDLSFDPWMIELLHGNPKLQAVATATRPGFGNNLRGMSFRIRRRRRARPTSIDAHAFHLGVVGYVDDVPPDGGGFTIWPGSHKHFYPTFKTAYTFNPLDEEKEYWDTDAWPSVAEIDPVHTYGSAGDVVLWHHRMGHGAGHNRSRQVRQAVLYDFRRGNIESVQDEAPPADMWRDWPGINGG